MKHEFCGEIQDCGWSLFVLLSKMTLLLWTSTIMTFIGTVASIPSDLCSFNLLCTCRKSHHEVICRGVPFSEFPQLPREAIYQVTIIRSGLDALYHNFLEGTSIASLHLMQNRLAHISNKAFIGLENILTTLDLSHNRLGDSSLTSFYLLNSLQWLNLEDNELEDSHLSKWSLMTFKNSLTSLFLGSNLITRIPTGTFTDITNLKFLDLEGNLIFDIDSHSFPSSLQSLSLSNNILKKVPLHAIYDLKNLKYLYLSGNLFQKLPCPFHLYTHRLERLEIGNNVLTDVPECVFNGSFSIKELNLEFNFIRMVPARSFKGTSLERLVMANNRILAIHSDAFTGIEKTLKTLDLSFNLIEEFPIAIHYLKSLLYLSLRGNALQHIETENIQGFSSTLEVLDFSGNRLQKIPKAALMHMKKLLRLSLQDNRINIVLPGDFDGWGESLTTLSLANNGIRHLNQEAFRSLKSLKELKLSFNDILTIDHMTLKPFEKTLEVLDLSSSLYSFNSPVESLIKNLKNLEWLQLDHNNISKIHSTSLLHLSKLRHLDMSYNFIADIPIDFLMSSRHVYLRTLNLGNNELHTIKSGSFWEISYVSTIILFGNKISVIEDYAFAHCSYLHTIVLSNNNITHILSSSFYNLTRLSNLFLQNNFLEGFSLDVIEGETSQIYLNLSNNVIKELKSSNSSVFVRTLDLTNNQLSVIPTLFFDAISEILLYLFFSKNHIERITLPCLPVLQTLDMSYNKIRGIYSGDLGCCQTIQILFLNYNNISHISESAFIFNTELRILDLSSNQIPFVSEHTFSSTRLERLNLSRNLLSEVPVISLKYLRNLDLSHNKLANISSASFTKLNNLQTLNMSSNLITYLEDESFYDLVHLLELDLSNNPLKSLEYAYLFSNLSNLKFFKLTNTDASLIRALPFPHLRSLSLSANHLTNVSQYVFQMCGQIKHLDVSKNFLQDVPLHLWGKMVYLATLDISYNPIEVLDANSFIGLARLQSLDMRGLLLKRLDPRALHGLRFLIAMRTDSYASVRSFRLQDMLSHAPALRRVTINIEESTLSHQVQRAFGTKLRELVITGGNLRRILPDAFAGLYTHELTIRISGTLVREFPDGLLQYLPDVRYLTLDLRKNQLTTMGPGVLAAVTRDGPDVRQTQHITGGVLLEDNPWTCTCELLWLGKWLRRWLRETFHVHMLSVEAALYVNSFSRKATCSIDGSSETVAIIDLKITDVNCLYSVSKSNCFVASLLSMIFVFAIHFCVSPFTKNIQLF